MNTPRRRASDQPAPLLSIIVPMYNEEDGADIFFDKIEPILSAITNDYEIVCVDDGSRDRTLGVLALHRARDARIKVVSLSRNFGKETALSAGLDYCRGQAVIPIDSDLQDPPELIPQMVEKWREGYEVVFARRISRDGDDTKKRLTSGWFYRAYNWIADVRIPDNVGDYRLMDRRVVEALKHLPERTRFMRGLYAWVGFKQIGLDFARPARAAGTTKYRYWPMWNNALDGITGSSTLPLRIWTYFGLFLGFAAFCYASWLIASTLIYGASSPGYASIMVTVLTLSSLNIVATGIMGEYLGRIFNEVRNRPLYLVRQTMGTSRVEVADIEHREPQRVKAAS